MQSHTILYSANDAIALALIMIWVLPWKGVALWKAAKNGSKWWFVILLIVNTVGILEILYIFIFSKMKATKKHHAEHHTEHHSE